MATHGASPTSPRTTALQGRTASSFLAAPPGLGSEPNDIVTSPSINRINAWPNNKTTSALTHPQALQQTGPIPPLTPASSTSSNYGQQTLLDAAQNAALTPQTSCTGGTTSTVPQQQSTAIIAPLQTQSQCCKTLEEAHLYPLMLIDLEIETQWKKHVLKPVTEILDHKVQDRLGHCQELVYAAKRGLWRGRSPPKPTIVVSVATKADRDRVKKHCKKMPRLQKDIADCQLRLMVVIDPVNLQAVHYVTDPTSASSVSTYITECTIAVDEDGRCAEKIFLLEPSAMTGEHTCTLGGTIVINDKLYGLTAGHAFQPTHLESGRRPPSVYSTSGCSAKTWLEDSQNPFVFPDDEDVGESELTDTCIRDGSRSPTMSVASVKACFPEALPPSIDDNAGEDRNAVRAGIISPLAPTVNPDHPKRIMRNCDWAIVELPRAVRTRQNLYQSVDSHAMFGVTRMAQETDRICGDVEVKLSHSTITRGFLSPNSTYYGIGPFLFDVRLVVLQRPLPRGCSGAWVLQGDTLCGYLISARNESLWAYMMPVQSVVEDVIQTLGVRSVRLPNLKDASLQAGNISDIVPTSQSDLQKTVKAAPGLLTHVAKATPREVVGRLTPKLTGIEVAGLALAIFPVVVEMTDWYSGNITGRDSKLLSESLRNNEQMFLNSLESLLRSVVPVAELQILLSDLTGDAWREQSLNHRVAEHLGCEVDSIMKSIDDIYRTVAKLKEKLPAQTATANAVGLVRAKTIVKRFLHGPHNKASLERLKIRITEFRELTKDALKLASSRNVVPKALRNLDLVQECASGLHDALQTGWQCNCEKLHPAYIELDAWTLRADEQRDKVHLKFSFLFADDAQQAQSDHWMTAEIIPSQASPRGAQASMLGSANDISLSPISLTSRDRAWTRQQTVSPSAISDTSQEDDADADNLIGDLCAVIKTSEGFPPRPVRHRHGSISDSNGHSYHLFSKFDPLTTTPTKSSVKLADFFNQSYTLSNRNRVRLALMLAWGVLQLSSTDWLRGNWTKDNILLVMDATNRPIPYISHSFQSSRCSSRSSTLTPTASNQMAAWVRHSSLFALGVFLLEMCYNRSIEDLATDEERGGKGEPSPYARILTAMRLSKVVQDELGLHYAQAVDACLRLPGVDMDPEGEPRDSAQFARSMMKNIIEPLEAVAKSFGE